MMSHGRDKEYCPTCFLTAYEEGHRTDTFGYVLHCNLRQWTPWWVRNWLEASIQRVAVNCLMSRERPVMSSAPEGFILGLVLFHIFFWDKDSGIECTHSKFSDDTKMGSAVDMLEEKNDIQRDLEGL